MIDRIASVWVPFEISPLGIERKCNDLPRFTSSGQVKNYIATHPKLAKRQLQWREHFEKEYIEEYVAGIGTLRILL